MVDDGVAEVLERSRALFSEVRGEVGRAVVGHADVLESLLVALGAGGHILLEGVPGLGKTLLMRSLAQSLGLAFKRVQCTPDLMPGDVLGTRILSEEDGRRRFEFLPGPVFTNILLSDEVNRATPKTQSALLEAMQEHAVTVAGERLALPEPFFVLATQNPIEMEGTYPLPEAQLDRFFFKLVVTGPSLDELEAIVDLTTGPAEVRLRAVAGREELLAFGRAAREVPVPSAVKRYALRLVAATHPEAEEAPPAVRRFVRFGASPRAAQAIVLAAKVRAALAGRLNASFEDVRWAALPALRHRIVLGFEGIAEGATGDTIAMAVLDGLPQLGKALEEKARRLP